MNIGLIGYGYWGRNYIRTLSKLDIEPRWICDDKNTTPLKGIKFTRDYREVLEDKCTDAVIIATPTTTHYKITKDSLENNKHVLVEKPMTTSSNEAEDLTSIAEKNGKVLMVGHTFMYNPAVQKLKEYIENGELGKVLIMNARRLSLGPIRNDNNVMWDLAPHDISMFLYLSNSKPESISVSGAHLLRNGIYDLVNLNLRFKNGSFSTLTASWLYPQKIRELIVVGDKKMAVFDDVSQNRLAIFDKGVEYINHVDENDFDTALREGDIILPRIIGREPLEIQCLHFLDCIDKGEKPLSNGKNGEEVVRILEAGEESLRKNGLEIKIKW